MKKSILLLICIALVFSMLAGCNKTDIPDTNSDEIEITTNTAADVIFLKTVQKDGSTTNRSMVPTGNTLGELLRSYPDLFSGEEGEYGYYITSVYGEEAEDGAYWAVYVDGEYAVTGVDGIVLNTGSTYELRYEKY